MDLLIHWALFAYVQLELEERVPWNGVASRACWMLQDIDERYQRRGQDVITPPHPPRNPNPPNQRAVEQISRETWSTSQRCAHVSRNVGHRSQPLQRSNHDMERDTYKARTTASIWDKTRPTCNDQPQWRSCLLGEPQGWRVIIILPWFTNYSWVYHILFKLQCLAGRCVAASSVELFLLSRCRSGRVSQFANSSGSCPTRWFFRLETERQNATLSNNQFQQIPHDSCYIFVAC